MSTHTAIATTSLGVLGAIQVTTEKPGPGEILLKTSHSSMIAFDTYDTDHGFRVQEYPMTLGFNAAGIVAAVGDGVTDLAVGDRVSVINVKSQLNVSNADVMSFRLPHLRTKAHGARLCKSIRSSLALYAQR